MQPRSRAALWGAVFVTAALTAVGFLPLFGGPGYEHALASGLIVPGAAAVAVSLGLSVGEAPSPIACVARAVATGIVYAALAFATALGHGLLRVGICDLAGGAADFVLTAGFGAVLGGLWGAVVAEVLRGKPRRRRFAVLLALAAPALGVIVSVARFLTSPMIFAFDPFVGFFSGTLYDTVVDAGNALFTYRMGSAATILAAVLGAAAMSRRPDGRLRFAPLRGNPANVVRVAGATAAAAFSLLVTAYGSSLGHWQTSTSIADKLGGLRYGTRCDVVMPESTLPEDADLLVKDCDEELAAVEAELGAKGPPRVRAFFFRDAGEKKRLMGAADTYIAKPWRKEVYLQMAPYPHPVLGHELAHVVAGSFGQGPFHVAGRFFGLWPNPGLIEGVAVAASPDDDELTDLEWAHAMKDLGALPPVKSVFSFSFFAAPAAKSYTLAGAFVRWVKDRYGAEVVRTWYGGQSIEGLTGKSWADLDASFREAAAKSPLSPEAAAYAKAKFERPSIFGRVCPHVVDAIRQHADQCKDAHEVDKARKLYDEVLARDRHDWAARYGKGMAPLRYGETAVGRRELLGLVTDPDLPRTWKDRTAESLADADLLDGNDEAAEAVYDELADKTLDEDFGRTAEVKSLAAADPQARPAVVALLLGGVHKSSDMVLAAARLGAWEDATGSPLASYLLGKNLSQRGWREEGAKHLDRIIEAKAYPSPRIGRETLRDRAIDACAMGDGEAKKKLLALVQDPDGPYAQSAGRKSAVLRMLDRCSAAPAANASTP